VEIGLAGNLNERVSAHCEGIAETPAQVEELTALCRLVASHAPTVQ
jgi:hypothetical protein